MTDPGETVGCGLGGTSLINANVVLEPDDSVFADYTRPEVRAWWGDQQSAPDAAANLTFTAADGVLIVPLDAYPRWLTLQRVRGLQIMPVDPNACGAFGITNVALYQRNIFR